MPLHFFLISAIIIAFYIVYINGILECIVSILTVLFIAFVRIKNETKFTNSFVFLVTISYSLYLTHHELGKAAVAVSMHFPIFGNFEVFRLFFGLTFSIIIAFVYYKVIEYPTIKLSSKIKYF